jgi:hypothetical protein
MVTATEHDEDNDAFNLDLSITKNIADVDVNIDRNFEQDSLKKTVPDGLDAHGHLDTFDHDDFTNSNDDKVGESAGRLVVTSGPKFNKKRRVSNEESAAPRASKRSRSVSIPPIPSINEESGSNDDIVNVRPKKGGRAKKKTTKGTTTPKTQQQGPSIVIPLKSTIAGTPSSTAKSTRVSLERSSFDATLIQAPKPTVVFSSSKFEELTQLLKSFKSFAAVAENVTEKTDFVW